VAAQVDRCQGAGWEAQAHDDRVVIVEGGNVLVEARANARHGDRILTDDPANQIDVVAAAIVNDATCNVRE
jgi:hypothetical protein